MPLLPAVVPSATGKRAERVPARLAANVAPLFGVPFPGGPFGAMTWLCDFTRITVSEIARGAPLLTRAETAELEDGPPAGSWVVHHRAVVGTVPNEIVNATTNRYGPHTKAAVLLTAANTLLEPAATGIEAALGMLEEGGELSTAGRIVVWACGVIEVFRSQPALVVAALKARAVQRESLDSPRFPRAPGVRGLRPARCEIGERESPDPATHPRDLHVLDRTVARLRLPGPDPGYAGLDLESDEGRASPARDLADELADRLARMLLDAAEPEGVGHVWISEHGAGRLVAEALLPASGLVEDLLEYWFSVHGDGDAAVGLPRLPPVGEFRGHLRHARRAVVLGALGIARTLRPDVGTETLSRDDFLALLGELDALAAEGLGEDDPAAAVIRCRVAVLRVTVLRHDLANSLREPLRALVEHTDRCLALHTAGVLDRGATADVLGAACVELNAVCRTNAQDTGAGLPSPAELDALLRRYWVAYGESLEIDLTASGTEDCGDVGHHLHNYAAFLGSHTESAGDLADAVRVFRDFVLPARWRLFRRTGAFGPLGRTLYVATGATSRLTELALAEGDAEAATRWADLGFRWISRVLGDREFDRLANGSGDQAGLFALRAAGALLPALELSSRRAGQAEMHRLDRLLATVDRWRAATTAGRTENYVRHEEAELLRKRVEALR